MRGGDLLVECLKAQGVRCLFGMPGTQNLQIYDSLLRRGAGAIDHYLVRHEYGATVMADGYARASGDVGVALTVPGPGASNASTGLLQAYTDCVPVLLMTGQHDSRHYGRDPAKLFHGLDQMSFFEPITRYRAIARTAADIPRVVEEAFRVLRAPRPGPAMLEFPQDAITGPAGGAAVPARVRSPSAGTPDEALLGEAARRLGASSRPLILAGNAVVTGGAREPLRALAEKLRAPVAATRRGKGALPEDHELALLDIRGYLARQAVEAADCTLAVGCRFTSIDTSQWECRFPRPLIQLDPEASEIGREYGCDVGVAGDLRSSLESLCEQVPGGGGEWMPLLEGWRRRFAAQPPLPLLPEIRKVLPDDGILSVDVHGIGYSAFAEYPRPRPRDLPLPLHRRLPGPCLPRRPRGPAGAARPARGLLLRRRRLPHGQLRAGHRRALRDRRDRRRRQRLGPDRDQGLPAARLRGPHHRHGADQSRLRRLRPLLRDPRREDPRPRRVPARPGAGPGRGRAVPGRGRDVRPPGGDHELGHLAPGGPSPGVRSGRRA